MLAGPHHGDSLVMMVAVRACQIDRVKGVAPGKLLQIIVIDQVPFSETKLSCSFHRSGIDSRQHKSIDKAVCLIKALRDLSCPDKSKSYYCRILLFLLTLFQQKTLQFLYIFYDMSRAGLFQLLPGTITVEIANRLHAAGCRSLHVMLSVADHQRILSPDAIRVQGIL